MGSICVFCGSGFGTDPAHRALAEQTGEAIAGRGWRMVYGGGAAGLMGVAARACLDAGGSVLGVIPEFLIPVEGAQEGADIRITATMGARKAMMVEEADAFLILPGGAGTLEEVFDMIMLRQLGRHAKPSAFADETYWAPLRALMRHVVEAGYAKPDVLQAMSFHDRPQAALDALAGAVEAAA
jgi:TIGR00730 family protein